MTTKFDLIDTFSRRPSLSPVASSALRAALLSHYPALTINPDVAAVTRLSTAGERVTQTLMACLHENFSTGKTFRWKTPENTLIADATAVVPVSVDVDIEQLAVLLDTVSLSLPDTFMQSLVDFWDRADVGGFSPWKLLAQALEEQTRSASQAATPNTEAVTPGESAAVFERQALDALEAQLSAIRDVRSMGLGDFHEFERYLANVTEVAPLLEDSRSAALMKQVSRLDPLPTWLNTASAADRLDYSRRIAALAVATARADGQSWNDGLPPILTYARKVLQDRLREDYPQITWLTLDDVTVHIAKVVAAAVPSAGQIYTVGEVENIQMSVATFALQNLSSLPPGTLTLSARDGGPLPAWLTADYLKRLVARVDIGRAYPDLVRQYLVTDESQAARRQRLFADQLRVQLPLKALEQKLRSQGGITQAGYQRVCALLERTDAGLLAVLRPLAWVAQPGANADVVGNMFVIAADDSAVGPIVLYRPFAEVPLAQFATWSMLRDAVALTGDLQDDVLTWMTQHGRQRYANGGFDEPHTVRYGQGSDFAPIEVPAPAQLSTANVQGDVMHALFSANAQALAELADRESVSNAESRWALIQRAGWLALDVVMPFLAGPIVTALWLVQLMVSVDQVLETQRPGTDREGREAWIALLLSVSMILLHRGFTPRPSSSVRQAALGPAAVEDGGPTGLPVLEAAESTSGAVAPADAALLDFSWSSMSHRLTQSQAQHLDRLKVVPEPLLGAPSAEPGKDGLYLYEQRWWVRLESGVYEVAFSDEGVRVVDQQHPQSPGPRLRRVGRGWALDLSLALRGGGPKRNARQLALDNAATLKGVIERDTALEVRKLAIYQRIVEWDKGFREKSQSLTPQLSERIEADLNALGAIFEQRTELQKTLRPADRVSEKIIAKNLQGISRRVAVYEGVLVATLISRVRTQLPKLRVVSVDTVTPDNVDAYLALFEELVVLKDRGVHWSGLREGYWQQLRSVPKVGTAFWREEVLEIQRTNVFTHLEWRINRLWSLLELSFDRQIILSGSVARELRQLRTDEALHAAFSSHAEVEKPNDYSLAEQIDVLESSLREYQRCTLIAVSARENAPAVLVSARFERFLEDLAWVSGQAEKRLSDLIRESAEPPEQLFEYAPRVSQPRKRVFKTRTQRTLVGKLREGESGLPGEVVDVTQAMSETIVGTYHLHENGDWVEVEVARASNPVNHERAVALVELKRQATAAIEGLESSINNARRQSRRADEPADMQDILVHQADRFTTLADKLASQTANPNQEEAAAAALQVLVERLRSGASRLVDEGRELRISMIKAQPPTAARLSYLAGEHEVSIARLDARKNMSGAKRNDFLQEYVIRDEGQRVLWWAHFHYASEEAAAEAFTAAHLKLPKQRFIGYKAQLKAAKDNKEVISIYRSVIGKDVAQRLFLSLAR